MYPLFEQCRVPTWILARNGGAFDGHYLGASLFDDHIRRLFSTNYALEFRGSYYDAWSCRDALPSAQ